MAVSLGGTVKKISNNRYKQNDCVMLFCSVYRMYNNLN